MNVIPLSMQRAAAYIAVVIILSGCTAPLSQVGAPGSMQSDTLTVRSRHQLLPQSSSGQDLLYVSGIEPVDFYTYPGGKMVGSLGTFRGPLGMCVDGAGDVFIPIYYDNQVLEYAHGGSAPIATITTANFPEDCSIDPTTGNLAVTFYDGIQIFSYVVSGWSAPQTYTQPDGTYFTSFCTYDNSGNLFFDSDTQHSVFQLTELLAGSSGTFTTVSLDHSISYPGGILWDGTYLAIAEPRRKNSTVVFRFSIADSSGTEVSVTKLRKGRGSLFWIYGSTIISEVRGGNVGFWKYPGGGSPWKTVRFSDGAGGVAVSPGT